MVGLTALRDCLQCPDVNLASIDLMYNRIGEYLIFVYELLRFISSSTFRRIGCKHSVACIRS